MSDQQLVKTDLAVYVATTVGGTCLKPWCSAGSCPEKGPACVNLQPKQKRAWEGKWESLFLFGLEPVP